MFLLILLVYLPLIFCQELLSFTSHLQLESPTRDQDELSRVEFAASPTYSLTSSLSIKSRTTVIYRPRSLEVLHRTRLRSLRDAESDLEQVVWDEVEVDGPDVEDLHTLAQLARMSGNAYALPGQKNWYDVDQVWNIVSFVAISSLLALTLDVIRVFHSAGKKEKGLEDMCFSLRTILPSCFLSKALLFKAPLQSSTNSTITYYFLAVVHESISPGYLGLSATATQDSLFYSVGVKLIDDLLKIYPGYNIWLVGHSLGGSLASLLGATYGLPAVAFEAPGERLAASRLHLPLPPSNPPLPLPSPSASDFHSQSRFRIPHIKFPFPPHTPDPEPSLPVPTSPPSSPVPRPKIATTHVYHNADPIPQGTCTGFGSPCAQAGYALETRCHLGQSIVFDTVNKLGWSVDVRKHPIREVVTKVLEGDIDWAEEDIGSPFSKGRRLWSKLKNHASVGGRRVPKPIIEEDCVDCYKWEFGDFKEKLVGRL